jgi:ATP-dependent Clp protease ATP-binding subunit ClpA
MYERFTDRARKVMKLANQEALRLNYEYIGTEHILMGLVKEGSGVAANILHNLNIDLRKIEREIEKVVWVGPATDFKGNLPQAPKAKRVVEIAIAEARSLGHHYVGTEHILLAIMHEEDSVAAQMLLSFGVTCDAMRQAIRDLLGHNRPFSLDELTQREELNLPVGVQEEVKELERQIEQLNQEKEEAVAVSDFEKAALLRDRVDRLRKSRANIIRTAKATDHGP